ncbi:MAG: A/G-specific adenine glycosylase [Eubacteriales bacterium]|nr:A/G-specific adenine glycosylase [Eubacteriales bacterium]
MDDKDFLHGLTAPLLTWYEKNKKPLPWRIDATPYHVWISEIMLQQTRIETVIPYYHRFMTAAPDVWALAAMPEAELMKLWEGLGYYSRARNLQKCAAILVKQYNGTLPVSAAELEKLPGIGAYTAGAIASSAYGQPSPAVDGNVLRVLARLLRLNEDVLSPSVRKRLTSELAAVYPSGKSAGALTQAIMELGETVCLPNGAPLCRQCPLAGRCQAHAEGTETLFPIRSKKKPRRIENKTVLLLRCRDRYAVGRRPDKGLLAGMYELPSLPGKLTVSQVAAFCRNAGLDATDISFSGEAVHIFTHIEWRMTGYLVVCTHPVPNYEWFTEEEIRTRVAVPSAFRYFLEKIKESP